MKQYFSEILDNVDVAIYVSDINTKEILYINEYTRQLFGDIEGTICWKSLQRGQDGPCSFCTNDIIISSDGKPTGVYQWQFQNTITGRWYDICDTAIEWLDGRFVRLEVASDITEHKKAEDKYRLLVESTLAVTWEVDIASLEFTYVSPQATNILGYPPDMWTNFDFWASLIYPIDREKAVNFCQTSTARGEDHEFEYRAIAADGRIVWIRDIVTVIKENNKPVALRGFLLDITQRKEAEHEREHLLAQLSDKNRELEQVLYASSHDLRTPLVNIGGYNKEITKSLEEVVSILQDEEDMTVAKEKISFILEGDIAESENYISKNILKMNNLLSGLLNLSRLGRQELKKEKLNMNAMMSDIAESMTYRVNNLGAKLELTELPFCTGDAIQINQLFSNLIENALKYLDPDRSGVIKISGRKEHDHSVYCVEDNGIGISPEHQENIFEIFYQLEPAKTEGEGLGLAIASRIVRSHGGKIWVESESGRGSKFFVSLPV